MTRAHIILLVAAGLLVSCSNKADEIGQQLQHIRLPPGFAISVFADGVKDARQLALGDGGTVFAGSFDAGKVYALVDTDGDHVADRIYIIDQGLKMPSGVAFRNGALYVGAVNRILRYDDIESSLARPPKPQLVTDRFPDKTHHGWKYLRFGPDGHLYVPVGAPCNICDEPGFAQIHRINADGSGDEIYASGVRNSVGLAFQPDTGELWFTDNGRDMLGDDIPSDELNRVRRAGQHFGYPYCHQGDLPDPVFGAGKSCSDYVAPEVKLGAHVAALGLAFYTGSMFPAEYKGQLFIARHGSWNRSSKVGYDIALVRFDHAGKALGVEVFASGWLQAQKAWGRPNDVLQLADGSLLVSDDRANAIYRISYTGK